jgi:hypothetical protein
MKHTVTRAAGALAPLALFALACNDLSGTTQPRAEAQSAASLADIEIGERPGLAALQIPESAAVRNSRAMVTLGERVFRYDTFGSEEFFGDELRLHETIERTTPQQAMALGLKVDVDALTPEIVRAIASGSIDLDDPSITVALLELDAVVGVTGFTDGNGHLTSVGVQCALCHSTVDDSLAPSIGHRRDGWPNQDLDIGRLLARAPRLAPYERALETDERTVRNALASWGPGMYDPLLLLDGRNAPVVIPPALGLAGVNLATYTGFGSVPYWNAYVANTQMMGRGVFFDPRFDDAAHYPIAARMKTGHIDRTVDPQQHSDVRDRVTGRLAALQMYQLALPVPRRGDTVDVVQISRGAQVFRTAGCTSCHVPPLYTEPGHAIHTAAEMGIDDAEAERGLTGGYRTTPLRAMFTHKERGFYHDGRFATLDDVVRHYERLLRLDLSDRVRADLIAFVSSL